MPVMPDASTWLRPRLSISSLSLSASAAFADSSSASSKPRSTSTLSVPCGLPLRLIAISRPPNAGEHGLQPFLDQFHVRPRCCDPGLGLLLKSMQHVHRIANPHRVDRAKGVAAVILHQLIHTGTEPFPRLGRLRRTTQL